MVMMAMTIMMTVTVMAAMVATMTLRKEPVCPFVRNAGAGI